MTDHETQRGGMSKILNAPLPKPEAPSTAVQCKRNQFKLQYVFPDGERELAVNAKYWLTDMKTGAIISEGMTDENGLVTDPACGKRSPTEIRIHAEYAMDFE